MHSEISVQQCNYNRNQQSTRRIIATLDVKFVLRCGRRGNWYGRTNYAEQEAQFIPVTRHVAAAGSGCVYFRFANQGQAVEILRTYNFVPRYLPLECLPDFPR